MVTRTLPAAHQSSPRESPLPAHAGDTQHFTRIRRWLSVYTIVTLLAIWVYAAEYLMVDRDRTLEAGRNALINVAAALNVHTEAIFADGLGSGRAVEAHLASMHGVNGTPVQEVFDLLRTELTGGEYVRALFVGTLDRTITVARSGYQHESAGSPWWLREAFNKTPTFFVGEPMQHPAKPDERVIPIAKRVAGEGANAVYEGAWFGIEALHKRYQDLLPQDGVMALVTRDGLVLARVASGSLQGTPRPQNIHYSQIFQRAVRMAQQRPMVLEGATVIGGETVLMMYAYSRPVPDASLMTAVGRARESILAPWRSHVQTVLIVSGIATVLLLLLTLVLRNYVDKLDYAQDALEQARQLLERRVAERTMELQQANTHLAAVNAELEEFSAAASHDLRSPLTTISGQAGLLELKLDGATGEEVRERLHRIQSGVRRAVEVIDGMLSLARISRQDLKSEQVSLSALVNQLLDELREQEPGREVESRIQPDVLVTADPRLMRSLLGNLVSNAWKYSAGQPRVELEFTAQHSGADRTYGIRDHGAGFDMANASRLFLPFRRLHSINEFPGTGIGLATVARIVHRYGGATWARSEIGKGATFYFTLPLAQPDGPAIS